MSVKGKFTSKIFKIDHSLIRTYFIKEQFTTQIPILQSIPSVFVFHHYSFQIDKMENYQHLIFCKIEFNSAFCTSINLMIILRDWGACFILVPERENVSDIIIVKGKLYSENTLKMSNCSNVLTQPCPLINLEQDFLQIRKTALSILAKKLFSTIYCLKD